MIKLRNESKLNLTLRGTVGSFQVIVSSKQRSLEIKYLLTHVGFNFTTGHDDALLSSLAPVREMFDPQTLDFDEIMQRDIDDARVSSDLIPYLLDEQAQEMIKIFPPIVVVVLPVEEDRIKPAERYPKVTREEIPPTGDVEYPTWSIRSGALGRELFQFTQPMQDGIPLNTDLVRLRLNTHKTRLVIVDGQHRAMALLAIYRNLRDQWTDERRAPFREYYTEWTPNYIQQFNLEQIQMPVMLCTIPDLDEDYAGDFDLKKAARAVFLTLNKNARKVSDSRNKLLDDNDLIAYFMRKCLSKIKQTDRRSEIATRIWNIELDQHQDKVKLQNQVAITGVSHIYYIIEHLMLENEIVSGVGPRSGKFSKRTNLENCISRLNGHHLLGAQVSSSIRRDLFSKEAAEKLGLSFEERYAKYLIATFDKFVPYHLHCRATLDIRSEVESSTYREVLPILFDGQGVGQVFKKHRENLKNKLKDNLFTTDVPEIEASDKRLDGTAKRIEEAVTSLYRNRAERFIARIGDKNKFYDADNQIHGHIFNWINILYDNIFTTIAFQSALICGFFSEIDRANITLNKDVFFDEYITQISDFFAPTSVAKFKKLLQVMNGEVNGDIPINWKLIPSNQTFRQVVCRGEMQPSQWPRYKYLMLEIWKPSDENFASQLEEERKRCRGEVFRELYQSYSNTFRTENRKSEEDLTTEERGDIFSNAYEAYNGFLKYLELSKTLTKSDMKQALKNPPKSAPILTDFETTSFDNSDEQSDEMEE
jgi:hypothetical protein